MNTSELFKYVARAGHKVYVLPVRNACNARCIFCATTVYSPSISVSALDRDDYRHLLERLKRCDIRTFEISGGGEPTLCRDLSLIISDTRSFFPNAQIKLYSNGLRLPTNPGVDELNLSRGALESNSNAVLMGSDSFSSSLKNDIARARDLGYGRIRISFPLCRGGVESTTDIRSISEQLLGLADAIVFRPLYEATPKRTTLLPDISDDDLEAILLWMNKWNDRAGHRTFLEVDRFGIFRKYWLIVGADGRLYRDFALKERISFLPEERSD